MQKDVAQLDIEKIIYINDNVIFVYSYISPKLHFPISFIFPCFLLGLVDILFTD